LEDSPLEAAMARRALAPTYDVETFSDGSSLLERAAEGAMPTVLVLDLHLPGMSGIEVCRFLRAQRDETALPILMLTVYGHKTDLLEGLEAGANDYVTKPYDAAELIARVATLVRVKTLFETARAADEHRKELLAREQAARAEAEAANAAKDEFLAMVSHELRTPLNAILGWTRLLRAEDIPADKHARALETIERNARSQAKLIEELLDTSRILSGTLRIEREPVELVNVLHLAVDATRPLAQAKKLLVEQRFNPDGALVVGDPVRLQQVVDNLLTNAIKFTPTSGNIVIELATSATHATVTVTDSGRGIAASFLPHVFERFRQAEGGPARSGNGLGLGLAIARRIVELHDGTIVAESAGIDRGATFRVSLPLQERTTSSPPPARVLPTAAAAASVLRGVRVLVVDDDPDSLELVATVLRASGAAVTLATSAPDAFGVIQAELPDVLVSDIGMPGQDGYELVRRVRALAREAGGRTPSMALSAFASEGDRKRAIAAGFTVHVAKPLDPPELVRVVAELAARGRD
jgi:signal transduction histidine kinase